MIGVASNPTELETVQEFFELFKTPWEPALPGRRYRVVLSTGGRPQNLEADVFLVYGASEDAVDREAGVAVEQLEGVLDAEWQGTTFPLYGRVAVFAADGAVLTHEDRALDYRYGDEHQSLWRVGYDLFDEVRHLLTVGQPPSRALTPTLDLHIALLRHLLLESGASFVEIPPHPAGCEFICCLTHDIDFFGIRRHMFDRTVAGFVVRASVGTLADLVRGRRVVGEAVRNWAALLSLPLVYLRLVPDFWRPVEDYARADRGRPSTFFVLPFKARPGIAFGGHVESGRAAKYQAGDVARELKPATLNGNEVAVHGIDAWSDSGAGREELAQITALTGRPTAGTRMHWLYFNGDSARQLEAAGFAYDSTWGYNDAVGYRAGTSQVFCLPGTERLLELPMSIMDSALFFPSRMGLSREEALEPCRLIVSHAQRFGGTVVINWHDRSLAPERLWGRAYRDLLVEVDRHDGVWYATGAEAIEWFRWRRSIRFRQEPAVTGTHVRISVPAAIQRQCIARVHCVEGGRVAVHDRPVDRTTVEMDLSSGPSRPPHWTN